MLRYISFRAFRGLVIWKQANIYYRVYMCAFMEQKSKIGNK